jgi:hypothetical protein
MAATKKGRPVGGQAPLRLYASPSSPSSRWPDTGILVSKRTASPGGVSGEAAERGQSGVGSGQVMVPVLTRQSKRWATLPT